LRFALVFFALRAIASLALRARSQRAAGGGFACGKTAPELYLRFAFVFLASLCGAKLGFGGKPLL